MWRIRLLWRYWSWVWVLAGCPCVGFVSGPMTSLLFSCLSLDAHWLPLRWFCIRSYDLPLGLVFEFGCLLVAPAWALYRALWPPSWSRVQFWVLTGYPCVGFISGPMISLLVLCSSLGACWFPLRGLCCIGFYDLSLGLVLKSGCSLVAPARALYKVLWSPSWYRVRVWVVVGCPYVGIVSGPMTFLLVSCSSLGARWLKNEKGKKNYLPWMGGISAGIYICTYLPIRQNIEVHYNFGM